MKPKLILVIVIAALKISCNNTPNNYPIKPSNDTISSFPIKETNLKIDSIPSKVTLKKTDSLLNISLSEKLNSRNPFSKLLYTKVVSYNFGLNLKREDVFSIYDKGKIHKSAILPGKVLKKEAVEKLFSIILKTSTYGGLNATCFDPKWALVFYNKTKIVGYIDICFACNSLNSKPPIKLMFVHKNIEIYGDETFVETLYGFTKRGRKKLKSLCKCLNMIHCGGENTIYD